MTVKFVLFLALGVGAYVAARKFAKRDPAATEGKLVDAIRARVAKVKAIRAKLNEEGAVDNAVTEILDRLLKPNTKGKKK